MKKITLFITLLSFVFAMQNSFAQTYDLLASFNGTNLEGDFGGTSWVYEADPAGGGGQVVKITNNPGEVWQGVNVNNLAANFRLTAATQLTMQLDVYSATPITIAPKAQGGLAGAPESITTASHTGSSSWETLTFTFNQSLDGKVPANGDYGDFALHINWNTGANNFGAPDGRVFYIKNLKGLTAPSALVNPTTAPTSPPARAAANVKSIYGDSYGAAVGLTNVPWDNADFAEESIASNNLLRINFSGAFMGSDLNTTVDGSAMTHFHMDYWIADPSVPGQVFNVKWSNHNGAGETDAAILTLPIGPTDVHTWKSIDVPLTDFNAGVFGGGIANRAHLKQLLITPSNTVTRAFIDNVYLHNNNLTLSTNNFNQTSFRLYPNPTQNSWMVKTNNVTIASIKVFDMLGKQVLEIAPNASESIIEGANLKTGLYFAQIETASGISNLKLVKK